MAGSIDRPQCPERTQIHSDNTTNPPYREEKSMQPDTRVPDEYTDMKF